jgi:type IV secretion system protein VirB8
MPTLLNSLFAKKPAPKTPIPSEVNKDALDFETSIVYLTHESEKRAWMVAFVAGGLAFILGICLILLMPLKSVTPYVIRYDSTTGYTDIMTGVTEKNIAINEAVSKFFVQRYVQLREGYYYELLQQDYDLVQQFGTDAVNEEYRSMFTGGKKAKQEVFGSKVMEKVEILSVVLGEAASAKTAMVRIKILRYDRSNMKAEPTQTNKIVTLAYEYVPNSKMSELYRLNNPLGFRVVTYRVDNEVVR